MTATGGEPTLGELARTLERMDAEINRRLTDVAQNISRMVTRDLYEAHRTAMQDDINDLRAQLQEERERKSTDRRQLVGAFISAGLSLLITIVSAALLIGLKLNS